MYNPNQKVLLNFGWNKEIKSLTLWYASSAAIMLMFVALCNTTSNKLLNCRAKIKNMDSLITYVSKHGIKIEIAWKFLKTLASLLKGSDKVSIAQQVYSILDFLELTNIPQSQYLTKCLKIFLQFCQEFIVKIKADWASLSYTVLNKLLWQICKVT